MNNWQSHLPQNVNSILKDWLIDQNSMTKRLKSICDIFHVDLIKEYFDTAQPEICDWLNVPHAEKIKFREAYLCCDNKAMIFAIVMMPESTLTKVNSLDTLKTKPIGEILFSDPSTKRGPLEFKLLDKNDPLFQKASQKVNLSQQTLWARRSVFTIQDKNLLVCEVFLF